MKSRTIAAMGLTLAGLLAGCAPSHTISPSASAPPAHATDASTTAPRVFTSPRYGYSAVLPAGWSAQANQRWGGIGAPGPVDVFRGQPNVAAWAFAVPRQASPLAYATAVTKTAAQLPCPAAPETSQVATIGGAPAMLIGMHCPARGGVLMLTAVTTGGKSTLVITFEDSSGISSTDALDRAAFRELLSGIRLRA